MSGYPRWLSDETRRTLSYWDAGALKEDTLSAVLRRLAIEAETNLLYPTLGSDPLPTVP